jgi:ABC-type multidrug transport system fused ATPase/permease subunit
MKRIISNIRSILTRQEQIKLINFTLLTVVVNIVDIAALALLVLLVSVYTQGTLHSNVPQRLNWLLDRNSMMPISLIVVLFIAKSLLGYWVHVSQYRYVYKVASRISETNLLKYLEGNYTDFVSVDSSVHIRKILHQPIEFCHYVLTGILRIAAEGILSLITISAILIFNTNLFLLLSLVLLPPVIIVSILTKKILKQARANAKTSSEKTLQYLQESLSGFIESNINNKAGFFADRYSKYQKKMLQFLADIETSQGISSRLIEVFAVVGLFVIILSNKLSGHNEVTIINIGAFMAAAYKLIPGIVKITNISGQIKTYEYTINDLLNHNKFEKSTEDHAQKNLTSIAFRDVSFNYLGNTILNNINFEIKGGDFVGISGPSGKGKTTFVNLMLGFLDQHSGEILINDATSDVPARQRFWKKIAYVQQRPFLLHDTVRTNITLNEETYDETWLQEVIDVTGLREIIDQSPDGINKMITENGKNISGGQRQRISIARALFKKADLIILDEPFSELDAHSEVRILEHLRSLSEKGKMIVMITHKKENLLYSNKMHHIDK